MEHIDNEAASSRSGLERLFRRITVNLVVKSLLNLLTGAMRQKKDPGLPGANRDLREMAALVAEMARSGVGTDECLELGCLPMPVHFYSPVPNIQDLEDREVWTKRSGLAGIDFRPEAQRDLLLRLGRSFGNECNWPSGATTDPLQFYTGNVSFGFGCAAALHSVIREFKPKRIVEVGSGNSSLIISEAVEMNKGDTQQECEYTIVDPFPANCCCQHGLPGLTALIQERVELLDAAIFSRLECNDILFVDSGHTVRIGGDVNFLVLDILPLLAPGVLVHFHDIPFPYEYDRSYFTNPAFRVFWTESYLLQAFLSFNEQWEILLAMNYLMAEHMAEFSVAFPHLPERLVRSGSFWIQRKNKKT
ncbi:MAG TPA: class I SAM-dependent methyltransferase [Syntrophorhabdales bacterium]|nr:class I SAM-dependent methyltransferase [Syntrophorhabdales bacterium]